MTDRPPNVCAECAKVFPRGKTGPARFCSADCRSATWRRDNQERHRENTRKWDIANPGRANERSKRYSKENRAKVQEKTNARRRKNPDLYIIPGQQRRARVRNAPGEGLTAPTWAWIKQEQGGRCAYCDETCKLTVEHVVPLISGGAHDKTNIVGACQSCNFSKGVKFVSVWKPDWVPPFWIKDLVST